MATLGFKKIRIGILDDEEKVTKVYEMDAKKGGAIEAKITGLAPETTKLPASNVNFYVSSSGTGDTKLSLGIADLQDDALAAIVGAQVDKGIMKIDDKTKAPYVAVILETEGLNNEPIYIALTKGKFSRDGDELKTGDSKGKEVNTDSLEGEFISRGFDGLVYAKGRQKAVEFDYKEFEALIFNGYTPS